MNQEPEKLLKCSCCERMLPESNFRRNKRHLCRNGRAYDCRECFSKFQKEYRQTDEYKEYMSNYRKTDVYLDAQNRYRQTDKYKEYISNYTKTDKYKENHRRIMRNHYQTPEWKNYNKNYQKDYMNNPVNNLCHKIRRTIRAKLKGTYDNTTMEIDHIVSLKFLVELLLSQSYSADEVLQIANDPMNIRVVPKVINRKKWKKLDEELTQETLKLIKEKYSIK